MGNKRIRKRPIGQVNLYGLGAEIKKGWQGASLTDKIGGIAGAAGELTEMLGGGVQSKAGNIMKGVGNVVSAIPGVGAIAGPAISAVGGLVNSMFGSKMNDEFIAETESNIKEKAATQFDANTNEDLLSSWDDFDFMNHVSRSQVGKDGWFSNKAKRKTKALNKQIDEANNRAAAAFDNRVNGLDTQNDLAIAANFASLGGHLFGNGGGIHIKKENRGKFTDYCGGKVTSSCIQRGLHSSNPTTRKRANFARNARGWHHAFGGELGTNGTDWTNGITIFGTGGSHEENPNQGIPQGVDPNGIPNLVEEGEVKFDDYIFSNRMKADEDVLEMVGLPKRDKGKKYSKLAEKAAKESEERPNDPISKLGLEDSMLRLQIAQEAQRAKRQNNKFAKGGKLLAGGGFTAEDFAELDADMEAAEKAGATAILRGWSNPGVKEESIEAVLPILGEVAKDGSTGSIPLPTGMRYAPAIGSAVGALATSLTPVDKPDYNDADSILRSRRSVGFTPLTQKLAYKPLDKEFYMNKLRAQQGATRRSLANAANGNRGTLIESLIGADYVAQNQMGDLFRQAEEYNQAQKERVAAFNRQTDQANAQMGIQTGEFNSEQRLRAAGEAARLRQAELQRYRADKAAKRDAIAANLTNFFDSLGGIGQENYWKNSLDSLGDAGVIQAYLDKYGRVTRNGSKGGKLRLKL